MIHGPDRFTWLPWERSPGKASGGGSSRTKSWNRGFFDREDRIEPAVSVSSCFHRFTLSPMLLLYPQCGFQDNRDHFDWVADKVRVTAENGGRTLVHCNAGVSRSAALCMAFLMRHRGATLLDAHAWLKSCRPIIRPNHGFWRQLIVYETELRGCSSVRMVPSPIGEIPDIYEEEVRNITPLL
uniref:Protein-tyrosine-phosphatase n=1 Tax=Oryzias sinensis TaxID=183150 RepID=A0A8C7Z9U6_9TELE